MRGSTSSTRRDLAPPGVARPGGVQRRTVQAIRARYTGTETTCEATIAVGSGGRYDAATTVPAASAKPHAHTAVTRTWSSRKARSATQERSKAALSG